MADLHGMREAYPPAGLHNATQPGEGLYGLHARGEAMSAEYDRFSSREDAPAWHPELFAQGQQARGEGRPLHGPDTPSADAVGDYCRRSWLAGWCDADMALLADADGNQDGHTDPAGMRVGA